MPVTRDRRPGFESGVRAGRKAWRAARLAILALCLLPGVASSQGCYVEGAFQMDFGVVNSAGGDATSNLSITCQPDYSRGRTYYYEICIFINPGTWSWFRSTRRMTNYNGAFLLYDLFSDPTHTQLIGAVGTTPVYRVENVVPPSTPTTIHVPIYGQVYPGQSVPSTSPYEEEGSQGVLRYRYSTTAVPQSADCTSGGIGGGTAMFHSSGVTARFDDSCWIVASDLDFGSVAAPASPLHEMADIRVQCAPGTAWKIGLDNGLNFDGAMRRMAGTGGYIQYQLYSDESGTLLWGDTEATRVSGTIGPGGDAAVVTVYGIVPPQPDAVIGAYADSVTATMYY